MKRLILALLPLVVSVPAFAQWHHHHYYGGGYRGGWVGPALIGGIIGYEINRSQAPVVVQQQPVIVQQPQVVYQPKETCGPWVETQHADGTITRTRTCTQ